jgi:hypothetical protein
VYFLASELQANAIQKHVNNQEIVLKIYCFKCKLSIKLIFSFLYPSSCFCFSLLHGCFASGSMGTCSKLLSFLWQKIKPGSCQFTWTSGYNQYPCLLPKWENCKKEVNFWAEKVGEPTQTINLLECSWGQIGLNYLPKVLFRR